MARPKKPRIVDGVRLIDGLYQHERKIHGKYRLKMPTGEMVRITAQSPEEANKIAAKALANPDLVLEKINSTKPDNTSALYQYVCAYIQKREDADASLLSKDNWYTLKKHLYKLAHDFADTPLYKLSFKHLRPWWEQFSHHSQKKRQYIYKDFFSDLIADGLLKSCEFNPFIENPKAYLKVKPIPPKQRCRLPLDEYWLIYNRAGELGYTFLQSAMGISLLTTMRRGDICDLSFKEHIADNHLKKVISKSEAQKGEHEASRLKWDLTQHTMLRKLINDAREASLKNKRCPYIISHNFNRVNESKEKQHPYQVLPNYLTEKFRSVRNDLLESGTLDASYKTVTFHEIRSLSSHLFQKSGNTLSSVQELMAHSDEKMTAYYAAGHEEAWTDIDIQISKEALQGGF